MSEAGRGVMRGSLRASLRDPWDCGARPRPEPASPLPACRLALYVYEYLLHVGAQKSAQTFLSEVSQPGQAEIPP